jgi:phosphoglycerate dehydrogenase-like enzyme
MSTNNKNSNGRARISLTVNTARPLVNMTRALGAFEPNSDFKVRIDSQLTAADTDALVEDLTAIKAAFPREATLRFVVTAGTETSRVVTEALLQVGIDWMN